MRIENNRIVTLCYELYDGDQDGELMERMDAHYPFHFMFGTGALLPAFESHLIGLGEGDLFEFRICAKEGYGMHNPEEVLDVPMSAFKVDGRIPEGILEVNQFITLTDNKGRQHNGKILRFDNASVTVDFNHYMAGKDLYFTGIVMEIREATVQELGVGHVILPDGFSA